jgi:phage terminase large subunit
MTTHRSLDRLEGRVGELLAERTRGRPLGEFEAWADDPVGFDRRCGRDPVDYQERIAESVRDHKFTVVRGCHAAGKEWSAGSLAVWAAYCRRMLVLIVSATERQVLGQTMREVRAAWRAATDLPGQLFTGSVRIGGEDRIMALTGGATVDGLTGWHDPAGVLVIISEGQGERLEDSAYDAAIACATDERSRVLAMGNPVRPVGRFYDINRKPHWNAIRVSAFDTPNVKAAADVRPGFPSHTWPAEVAREYGETSAYYQGRVLAEFPDAGSVDALLRRDWLEAAFDRHDAGVRFLRWPPPVVALDVARSLERDESAAAAAQGKTVHRLYTWRSRDLVDTAGRFRTIADRTRLAWYTEPRGLTIHPASPVLLEDAKRREWLDAVPVPGLELAIDAPGIGGGVCDILRRERERVTEWWGWVEARDSARFANLRAAAYWGFREMLDAGEAVLPRDPLLLEEALAVEWSTDAKGRIIMAPKDEIRKLLGRSPDRLDAVVMALATANGEPRQATVSFTALSA